MMNDKTNTIKNTIRSPFFCKRKLFRNCFETSYEFNLLIYFHLRNLILKVIMGFIAFKIKFFKWR